MRELLLKTQQEVHDTNTKWNKVIDSIKEIDMSDFLVPDRDLGVKQIVFDRDEYRKRIDLIIKLAFHRYKVGTDLEIIRESEDEVDNDQ